MFIELMVMRWKSFAKEAKMKRENAIVYLERQHNFFSSSPSAVLTSAAATAASSPDIMQSSDMLAFRGFSAAQTFTKANMRKVMMMMLMMMVVLLLFLLMMMMMMMMMMIMHNCIIWLR